MITEAFIGILATHAYPYLEAYMQSIKQTDAKVRLSGIFTVQKIYFTTDQTYVDYLSILHA